MARFLFSSSYLFIWLIYLILFILTYLIYFKEFVQNADWQKEMMDWFQKNQMFDSLQKYTQEFVEKPKLFLVKSLILLYFWIAAWFQKW